MVPRHRDQFALPSRISFRHLYFSPDRRGARARDDAAAALTKLAGQPQESSLATTPRRYVHVPRVSTATAYRSFSGKEFGPNFALAVAKLAPGSWQGPVEFGFGWHLVFIDVLIPDRVPAFEEVEDDVEKAWLAEQRRRRGRRRIRTCA